MLTYQQCKTLKDVGFPMKKALPDSKHIWGGTDTEGIVYEYPTLSELIEACGGEFYRLMNTKGLFNTKWIADSFNDLKAEGETPLEAVYNLYLAIKK